MAAYVHQFKKHELDFRFEAFPILHDKKYTVTVLGCDAGITKYLII